MNIFKLGIKFLFHIFSNFEIKYVMDFNVHCAAAAGKAEFVLSQVSRAFHYRDKSLLLNLYKQFVRPRLEFSVPVQCP